MHRCTFHPVSYTHLDVYKRQTTYTYDAANRLVQTVTNAITTTYAYDGWGTLIRETRDGLTTDLVLDEQVTLPRVLAAIRSDGYKAVSYTHLDVYKRQPWMRVAIA